MGRIFLEKKVGPQTLSAQIGPENEFGNELDRRLFIGEIDP